MVAGEDRRLLGEDIPEIMLKHGEAAFPVVPGKTKGEAIILEHEG